MRPVAKYGPGAVDRSEEVETDVRERIRFHIGWHIVGTHEAPNADALEEDLKLKVKERIDFYRHWNYEQPKARSVEADLIPRI